MIYAHLYIDEHIWLCMWKPEVDADFICSSVLSLEVDSSIKDRTQAFGQDDQLLRRKMFLILPS